MSTLNPSTVDYLLYRSIEGGLKQFKGYSAKIDEQMDKIIEENFELQERERELRKKVKKLNG